MINWLGVRAFCYTFYKKLGYSETRINKALDQLPMLKDSLEVQEMKVEDGLKVYQEMKTKDYEDKMLKDISKATIYNNEELKVLKVVYMMGYVRAKENTKP